MNAAGTDTRLDISGGTVTLSGGGTMTMSDSTHNRIGNLGLGTLINVDNTIQGAGTVNALSQFVNEGTILADEFTAGLPRRRR